MRILGAIFCSFFVSISCFAQLEHSFFLKDDSKAQLSTSMLGNAFIMAGSCSADGLGVAVSAILDTIPLLNIIPHSVALNWDPYDQGKQYTSESYVASNDLKGVAPTLLGAGVALLDIVAIIGDTLPDGKVEDGTAEEAYDQPFEYLSAAYNPTKVITKNLFNEQALCRSSWAKLSHALSEASRRIPRLGASPN